MKELVAQPVILIDFATVPDETITSLKADTRATNKRYLTQSGYIL